MITQEMIQASFSHALNRSSRLVNAMTDKQRKEYFKSNKVPKTLKHQNNLLRYNLAKSDHEALVKRSNFTIHYGKCF